MAIGKSSTVPGHMQTLFDGGMVAGLDDGQLLDRFLAGRDAAAQLAFAALVDRHGPMVLGVCRRIIPDRHAAEDAFQATFLVLARRARSVRVGDSLGRWLYGVSRRVALRERAVAARRPTPAGASAEGWEAGREDRDDQEVRGVLDEEVARLPRRLREAVTLCHFEGLSFAEAASRAGCPIGTVGSRLTRARSLLRSRLARRGFSPTAILAADAGARVQVSSGLAGHAAELAFAGLEAPIPIAVSSLSTPILRSMSMIPTKIALAATAFLAGLIAAGAVAHQPPAGRPAPIESPAGSPALAPDPADDYDRLVREFNRLVEREAGAREKGQAAFDEHRKAHPGRAQDEFASRFLELAASHPAHPVAFDALLWVVVFDFTSDLAEQAAGLLARDHGPDPRLWPACQEMTRGPIYPARGILLRAIYRDSPDRSLRGRAGLALVEHLQAQAEFVRLAKVPGPGPYQARFFPADRMERFRELDPDAMTLEAERVCTQVLSDYPDVRPVSLVRSPNMNYDARTTYGSVQDAEDSKGTLGDLARSRLDEIRGVAIGGPSPDLVGADEQGKVMRLDDFRGKVVLLTFSGDWCGPCVSMYPHERELVGRFAARPFALLSVNSDKTREQLAKSIESGAITWRCWWEPRGDMVGPIAERWHVRSWPTIFAIDHNGVIRARSSGTLGPDGLFVTGLDEVVEGLVKEAEQEARCGSTFDL